MTKIRKRTVTVYQCWSGDDMAQSDTWYGTLAEAKQHAKDAWNIPKTQIKFDASGNWDGECEADGFDVHICRCEIIPTADGISNALTHLPNR